jgi:hypothetical protein
MKSRRAPSWKATLRPAGVCALFAASLVVFSKLFPLIPRFDTFPPIVALALPLGSAWLLAAGMGSNFVPGKQALALATACLVVAAPVTWWSLPQQTPRLAEETQPAENAPVEENVPEEVPAENAREEENVSPPEFWTPPATSPPENVPENLVAFHFVSAYSYVGGGGGMPLEGLDLDLPWPHVGGWCSVGIPDNHFWPDSSIHSKALGNDNYLRAWASQYPDAVFVMHPSDWENENEPPAWLPPGATFVVRDEPWLEGYAGAIVYWKRLSVWLTYPHELGSNRYSEITWLRLAIEKEGEVILEKLYENGVWRTTKDGRYLRFRGVQEPFHDENILAKAAIRMVDEEWRPRGSLYPGETVVLEGLFLVPEDNENDVRIGDLYVEGAGWLGWTIENRWENRWYILFDPGEWGQPKVSSSWEGPATITEEWVISLEKMVGDEFEIVEKFAERMEDVPTGYGYIDRVI